VPLSESLGKTGVYGEGGPWRKLGCKAGERSPGAGLDKSALVWQSRALFNSLPEGRMSLTAHLAELTEKHRMLEKKIEEEMARPGVDSIKINRLKLEKLRLKDEIARLKEVTRH
jgi:hypothetical protein